MAVKRTQRNIQMALMALLGKYSFEKITINDIAESAMVDRSTFYRYYHNKYEVLIDSVPLVFETPFSKQTTSDEEFVLEFAENMANNRVLIRNIFSNIDSFAFYRDLIRIFSEMLREDAKHGQIIPLKPPIIRNVIESKHQELSIELFCNAIVGLMISFVEHNLSKEELSEFMLEVFRSSFKK
jgi:AcrR family transcriptional regulator